LVYLSEEQAGLLLRFRVHNTGKEASMRLRYLLPILLPIILLLLVIALFPAEIGAQKRTLLQDPALDNLHHAAGVKTTPFGALGNVRKVGEGKKTMVLIPGLGFGDDIWTEFMESHKTDYTMFAVTLPGFGDTPPLPMPPDGTRYAELTWTRSSISAIEKLLDQEHIERVTLVAQWALAPQIALQLALDHPDRVEAVVLIGGAMKAYYENTPMMSWTAEQRDKYVEGMASRWFKTVTRRTWDDNNFMSYDYAVNPRRGLFLWREAQAPPLTVWIRYLLEFYSIDLTSTLKTLRVPTLVVHPGFDDPAVYVEQGHNYMRNLCIDSWRGMAEANNRLEFVTIPRSRLFIMFDEPEELNRALASFLSRKRPG
jgi:pimeloyl-ACP methyl ester carboxylesterase